MCQLDISIFVLQQIGAHAVKNSRCTKCHCRCVLAGLNALSGCLDTDQFHVRFLDKISKHTDGVGASADTGDHSIR